MDLQNNRYSQNKQSKQSTIYIILIILFVSTSIVFAVFSCYINTQRKNILLNNQNLQNKITNLENLNLQLEKNNHLIKIQIADLNSQISISKDTKKEILDEEHTNIFFNVNTAKIGDIVAALTITSVQPYDETHELKDLKNNNAKVSFTGKINATGKIYTQPEMIQCAWFTPDKNSQKLFPRIEGDDRDVWFCFENQSELTEALGSLKHNDVFTVLVENYTINSYPSEVWNTAKFVQLIE